jgi:beta-lactamase superfamily II metal-dependent hydrolase
VTAATEDCLIYVLGADRGESIVIKTKLGFGLIDCFKHEGKNPPLDLLKSLGAESLSFLALTHPHDDHFQGFDEVVDYFLSGSRTISFFWRYPVLQAKYLRALLNAKGPAADTEALFKAFEKLAESKVPMKLCGVGALLLSAASGHGIELVSIAPAAEFITKAEEFLVTSLDRGVVTPQHMTWDLNRLSSAFLIRYGSHRLILAGDVPGRGWNLAVKDPAWPSDCGNDLYKSAHHGSGDDNTAKVLAHLSSKAKNEWAIVTRYSRHDLPDADGLKSLNGHFNNVRVLGKVLPSPRVLDKSPRLEEVQKYGPQIQMIKLIEQKIVVESLA